MDSGGSHRGSRRGSSDSSSSDEGAQGQANKFSEWRRDNTALYLQYLARAVKKGFKLPFKSESGECILRPIHPEDITTDIKRLQPFMFPPEFTDRYQARKSFKKYGHWKKVDFDWVEMDKIISSENEGVSKLTDQGEVFQYWKRFIEDGIPIPAIRVYSEDDLTIISDGVQRMAALKDAGFKHALVFYRYETNEDPNY